MFKLKELMLMNLILGIYSFNNIFIGKSVIYILVPCISMVIVKKCTTKIRMIILENVHKYCRKDMWITSYFIKSKSPIRYVKTRWCLKQFISDTVEIWLPWKNEAESISRGESEKCLLYLYTLRPFLLSPLEMLYVRNMLLDQIKIKDAYFL